MWYLVFQHKTHLMQPFTHNATYLGSVREVLEGTGAVVAGYDYSPFGEVGARAS